MLELVRYRNIIKQLLVSTNGGAKINIDIVVSMATYVLICDYLVMITQSLLKGVGHRQSELSFLVVIHRSLLGPGARKIHEILTHDTIMHFDSIFTQIEGRVQRRTQTAACAPVVAAIAASYSSCDTRASHYADL